MGIIDDKEESIGNIWYRKARYLCTDARCSTTLRRQIESVVGLVAGVGVDGTSHWRSLHD